MASASQRRSAGRTVASSANRSGVLMTAPPCGQLAHQQPDADGKDDDAIKTLRSIAEKEESTGEEPIGIPAREMLADLLLELNRPEQALAEYETDLKFNPNRFNGLYGAARAAEMAGKNDKAGTYYAQLVKVCDGSSSDRPELSRARGLLAKK